MPLVQLSSVIVKAVPEPASVLVEQNNVPVKAKLEAKIDVTGSLSVNEKVIEPATVVALMKEFASLAQVKTGAILSAMVTLVVADAVAIDPLIPF